MHHRLTAHQFRHLIATEMIDQGIDAYTVKEFLGHSSLTMTERMTNTLSAHLFRLPFLSQAHDGYLFIATTLQDCRPIESIVGDKIKKKGHREII
jgi:hypothetical protein